MVRPKRPDPEFQRSLEELDAAIAGAIERHPELRMTQLEARVAFAVAEAIDEVMVGSQLDDAELAARSAMPLDTLLAIRSGEPQSPVTLAQLAAIASALGHRFYFQLLPPAVADIPSLPAAERRALALRNRDRAPTLWQVADDDA